MKFVSQQVFISLNLLILTIMKIWISSVLFFITTLHLISQNLVINPGFETWQKTNKPTGWTTALSCLKDSLIINSGSYSCRQAATADSKELGQIISVIPGNQYRISFFYRNEITGSGNGCRIWSGWKDTDGVMLKDTVSEPFLQSKYLKSDTWKQYEANVTAPSDASYFNLIIRTLPNCITYWDDILFEESVPTYMHDSFPDDIILYPNPTHDYLVISNIQNLQCIEIQTITGIVVLRTAFSGQESTIIPVSGLEDGLYIIVMTGSGSRISKKFIKN